jgi:hypothetical protein
MTENTNQTSETFSADQLPNCKCGCKNPVNHPESIFRPGHDARFAGSIARQIVLSSIETEDGRNRREALFNTVPSAALQNKVMTMVFNLEAKADAKASRAARRSTKADDTVSALPPAAMVRVIENPTEAQRAEGAAADPTTGTAKVGRWDYPAYQNADGTTQRNTSRDGSGQWVPVVASAFTAS